MSSKLAANRLVVCPLEAAIYRHIDKVGTIDLEPVQGDLVIRSEPDSRRCTVGFFECFVDDKHREGQVASFPQGGDLSTWLIEEFRVVPASALEEEVFGQCPKLVGLPRQERRHIVRSFRH